MFVPVRIHLYHLVSACFSQGPFMLCIQYTCTVPYIMNLQCDETIHPFNCSLFNWFDCSVGKYIHPYHLYHPILIGFLLDIKSIVQYVVM